MKKLSLFLLALNLLLMGVAGVQARTFSSENLFYLKDNLDSFHSFKGHAAQISIVVPAAYNIDQYGTITGGIDPRVLKIAKKQHVMVMPLIASFDQTGIHKLLNDPKARARAINIMLYDANENHFFGWQFDLENVHVTDGAAYTDFFRQAAHALHNHGLKISMAVVKSARPVPAPGSSGYNRFLYDDWRGAFDFKKLAGIADFLSFMSYDQHTSLTPPGPVAGIPWIRNMADYLMRIGIDPQKLSFGIPTYSDYWYPAYSAKKGAHSTRDEISYRRVRDLLDRHQAKPRWMSQQRVNYARWTEANGVFNWLFIEDARSFKQKLRLVQKYHFRGFSAWVLGDEDPAIWKVIERRTKPRRY